MKRIDCLRTLSDLLTTELVVIGAAGQYWEWNHLRPDHEGSIKICSMGNTAAVGLSMAFGLPHRRVVVLDSDGSALMDLATVTTMGTYRPANLVVFVFDNERYSGSRISEPTATAFNSDLEGIARAAGIPGAVTVQDLAGFADVAASALAGDALAYVVSKVEEDPSARTLPKPTRDYLESKYRFVRYVERTEEIAILPILS